MKQITVRLKEGQYLREEIERMAKEQGIQAGVVLSVVGGIKNAVLRMPRSTSGEHVIKRLDGPFELVSCTGTISPDGCHLHVSISDSNGHCHGGHLKEGCEVFFTVELVIGVFEDAVYRRVPDKDTGFDELETSPK